MNVNRDALHVVRDGGCLIREAVCPICGKRFARTNLHAWRTNIGTRECYLCSYTCMRKAEKEKAKNAKKTGRPKKSEEAKPDDDA